MSFCALTLRGAVFSFIGRLLVGVSTGCLGFDLGFWIVGGACLGWGMSTGSLVEIEESSLVEQSDNVLGSLVDGLVETERLAARVAAWKIEQVDQVRGFAELNIPVTT